MASGKFSIDDAFESDEEDPIRVYGSTTESAPLQSKRRPEEQKESRDYSREVNTNSKPLHMSPVGDTAIFYVDSSLFDSGLFWLYRLQLSYTYIESHGHG